MIHASLCMTTKTTMTSFFKRFVFLDLLLGLFFLVQGDITALLNTQVAALSAALVAAGSFMGYRHAIREQVENMEGGVADEQDLLDKIDDTYDLFDEDEINEAELSSEEVKQIFAEEKSKVKQKSSIKNVIRTSKGIFSPFRLFAYGFLIFGFFWLEGNANLLILPYLLGLSLLPATAVVSALTERRA